MKKTLITCCLYMLVILANAQRVSLKTLHTEPRKGEKITITLDLKFIDDYIKATLPSELEMVGRSMFTAFTRHIQVNDTGDFQIGPYQFEFNGKTYLTDSINLHVIEPLKKEEGLWIRLLEYDSNQLLIVEQYMSNQWTKEEKSGSTSSRSMNSDLQYAKLVEHPTEGLTFFRKQSITRNVRIDDTIFGPTLGHSLQVYRITNQSGKQIKLVKKYFINLPKRTVLPDLIIKKTN